MNDSEQMSRSFHRFTKIVLFTTVVLVWWGAATTTKDAGMAFADWPLSLGSVNPPGWLSYTIPFLEHSHRLLATLVGLLVLALFAWAYVRSWGRLLEVVGVVLMLAVVFGFFVMAGAERIDPERKQFLLIVSFLVSLLPLAWLGWSWICRSWTCIEKLTALALIMVTAQAIKGGLRVTEISDVFAVLHGCLAQVFFCLLVLIMMVSGGESWRLAGFRSAPPRLKFARITGIGLLALISTQLVLGASMRHFHRFGLADTDWIRTQGQWVPAFDDPIITVMFLHKFVAFCVLVFLVGMVFRFMARGKGEERDSAVQRHLVGILALIVAQIVLGVSVIGTEKQFWITNVHVLNGLAILALSFVFVVRAWIGSKVVRDEGKEAAKSSGTGAG